MQDRTHRAQNHWGQRGDARNLTHLLNATGCATLDNSLQPIAPPRKAPTWLSRPRPDPGRRAGPAGLQRRRPPSTGSPSRRPSTPSSPTSRPSSRARPTSCASPSWRSCREGHVLFEDLPGTGKSVLARALGQSMDATASRVQCTPDMLPGDITGSSIFDQRKGEFEFRPGPVFTNILLADEINRATPKTQSALLEAMAERRVSADGTTLRAAPPVPRARHAEPGGAGGHLPAPRSPARPLPVQAVHGLHDPRGRARGHVRRTRSRCSIDDLGSVIDTEQRPPDDQVTPAPVDVSPEVGMYIVDLVHATRGPTRPCPSAARPRATISLLKAVPLARRQRRPHRRLPRRRPRRARPGDEPPPHPPARRHPPRRDRGRRDRPHHRRR